MFTPPVPRAELIAKGWTNDHVDKYLLYIKRRQKINLTGRSSRIDSEMSRVYSAENNFIRAWESSGKTIMKFASLKEANQCMEKILKSKTWQKVNKANKHITLVEKRAMSNTRFAGRAQWDGSIVLCPLIGYNLYILIHELAHQAGHMHHDVSFRKTLLILVSRFMGIEAAALLKKEFKDNKLRMTRHTTVMTPDQWFKANMKVASARAAA